MPHILQCLSVLLSVPVRGSGRVCEGDLASPAELASPSQINSLNVWLSSLHLGAQVLQEFLFGYLFISSPPEPVPPVLARDLHRGITPFSCSEAESRKLAWAADVYLIKKERKKAP